MTEEERAAERDALDSVPKNSRISMSDLSSVLSPLQSYDTSFSMRFVLRVGTEERERERRREAHESLERESFERVSRDHSLARHRTVTVRPFLRTFACCLAACRIVVVKTAAFILLLAVTVVGYRAQVEYHAASAPSFTSSVVVAGIQAGVFTLGWIPALLFA